MNIISKYFIKRAAKQLFNEPEKLKLSYCYTCQVLRKAPFVMQHHIDVLAQVFITTELNESLKYCKLPTLSIYDNTFVHSYVYKQLKPKNPHVPQLMAHTRKRWLKFIINY